MCYLNSGILFCVYVLALQVKNGTDASIASYCRDAMLASDSRQKHPGKPSAKRHYFSHSLCMKLSEGLLKLLGKSYEPSAMINMQYKGNDIDFKTDDAGRPILLFIGERTATGTIKGERYARRLAFDKDGNILKDHWELKGKAS